jgi:hypothetical protein
MKTILPVIMCLFLSVAVSAQSNSANIRKETKTSTKVTTESKVVSPNAVKVNQEAIPAETLVLKETVYDFGKIPQGKPVTHIFEYTNSGKTPIVLDNVQASCGCTTPVWSKNPVPAGGTSQITVGFNAASEGAFTKQVNISYNGNLSKQIIIKGEVYKTPDTSAPQNSGINNLKNQQ